LIGVLVPVGAPDAAALGAAGRGPAGAGAGTVAALVACGIARFGTLVRGGGAEFGCAAGAIVGPDGRGATIGRAVGPAAGAPLGIIGRGGNNIGRPAAGWAVGCAGCGDAIDGFAIGALSTAGDGGTRFGSGITGGIALGAGVAPFGTRAGSDVSRSAAARAALAR
jgi:hypothetical protein